MVFAPSGGVVDGRRPLSDGASAPSPGAELCAGGFGGGGPRPRLDWGGCRCSEVTAGWMPTIVALFAVIGRICGALARGKPGPLAAPGAAGAPGGRAAGDIARGVAAGAGAGAW
jgi:hypothetical protein